MLIWRGIAPIRVEDGVQMEGPDVEREAIRALQAVAVAAYWAERKKGFYQEIPAALEAAGFDTARGTWRTEAQA